MLLNKVAEWRVSVLEKAMIDNVKVSFSLTAMWSEKDSGFVVLASVDGKGGIYVSSQRREKRVFKTLDALRRATQACDIPSFQVVG